MTEPLAYLDGAFVPLSAAKLSVFDMGVVHGAAVTEMIRTFRHQPFRLNAHLDRLFRSLKAVRFPGTVSRSELERRVSEVVEHNAALIPVTHDLGVIVFVTAGLNLTYLGAAGADLARVPTVGIHTFPLPFELWAEKLELGQHLITPNVRQIPPDTVDPKIKSRSRLHWYLADREARLVDPNASALLLDRQGNITETSSGNFLVVVGKTIRTPTRRSVLAGVSRRVVAELAAQIGCKYAETDLQVYDAVNADEAFTSSTPSCLLPVSRLNGHAIGDGRPGPVFQALMAAWNELVGVDIIAQTRNGARDRTTATV
jgi:branched-subunit amino acid aminotransferase/4-amino-4-deoxychorismate lyase